MRRRRRPSCRGYTLLIGDARGFRPERSCYPVKLLTFSILFLGQDLSYATTAQPAVIAIVALGLRLRRSRNP